MELDEMKTAWKEMDERLERREMLSAAYIKESIAARSQRSVSRFLNYEMISAAIALAAMPFVVWKYGTLPAGSFDGMKLVMSVFLLLLPLLFVWQIIKIVPLFKLDMSKGVKDNIARVRRYELYALYEKRFSLLFFPLLIVCITAWVATVGAAAWWWAGWGGATLFVVFFTIWYYKKFYADNMGAIKRGLDELKDL
jgi:hypothetical protein